MQRTFLFAASVMSVTLLGQAPSGNAKCCYPTNVFIRARTLIYRCADCSRPTGKFCAMGIEGCNIFGCKCDGGCRRPIKGRICTASCCDDDGLIKNNVSKPVEAVNETISLVTNLTNLSQTRFEDGTEASVNEYPMVTALIDVNLRKVFCGATLVSAEFVLTSALCLLEVKPEETAVLVGEHDTSEDVEFEATDLIQSSEFIFHPKYDMKTQTSDIALVRLSRPVVFSTQVVPACLPFRFKNRNLAGLKVVVLGWKNTQDAGSTSSRLLQAKLSVVDAAYCRGAHPSNVMNEEKLCTFQPASTLVCQDDPGGPVMWTEPTTGFRFVVGIVGYGVGCPSQTPSINTKVDMYLDWIQEHTLYGIPI